MMRASETGTADGAPIPSRYRRLRETALTGQPAFFHTALADATICAWDAKWAFNRIQPSRASRPLTTISAVDEILGSYVSEHAVIAGAASAVLNYLFPGQTAVVHDERKTFDAIANEAGLSRLWAGASYRSDVEVGVRMGQSIAYLAVSRGETDGSKATWDRRSRVCSSQRNI